jgi:hypothetical protein
MHNKGVGGWVYFLTVIGAAVYFVQRSAGFWGQVVGFLKGLIWPAVATYKILELWKI